MLKNFFKIILILILSIFSLIIDSGFSHYFSTSLNIPLVLVIFFSIINPFLALLFSLSIGLLSDIFSIFPFFVFTISFLATFFLVKFLVKNVFTTRNFVSLFVICLSGILIYHLIFYFLVQLTYLLKLNQFLIALNQVYFIHLFFCFINNLAFILVFFALVHFFQKKIVKNYESTF